MNAERLLEVYEQISEAPDAIARLRRFVLDLAVRGKLVEQDAGDEPSSRLIEDIARERARSQTDKKRKTKGKSAPVPFAGELYQLPSGWSWSPLSDLSDVTMGQSPPGSTYNKSGDGVPLINGPVEFTEGPFGETVVNQYTTEPTNFCEAGDFLVCVRGSTTGRTNVAAFRACIGRGVAAVRSTFEDGFIRLFLWKSREDIIGMGRGIAFPSVSKKQLEQLAIPLPPLAEQHRIVAKVDELMTLCDRLEEARKTREEVRDKLTAASLARLTAPDTTAEDFPAHATFALEALPALTTRPEQIKTLRQTLLNLAVCGKLVEQDPQDEPASELLNRIGTKRAELVKTGEAKKLKPRKDETWPFAIPDSWTWCALGEVSSLVTKGSSPKWQGVGYVKKDAGLLFITSENVGNFTLRKLDELKYVEARFKEIEPRSMLRKGDILINLVGASIGRSAIYDLDAEANINQAVALVRMTDPEDCPSLDYLLMYLNSDLAVDLMLGSRVTTAQPNISLTDVTGFPVPLPPLTEQQRIVAKVDALMALCDRLEAALTTADTTCTRLLESLLHEALEPASEVLEAAE